MSDTASRIEELEIRVAYQDDLLLTLNEVVSDQQRQLIRLEEVCKLLARRIKSMVDTGSVGGDIEIPPHY